jgi:aarF domain-containing kinase
MQLSLPRARSALAVAAAGAGAYVAADSDRREAAVHTASGVARFSRAAYHGARAAADYKLLPADAVDDDPRLRAVHRRSAERLLLVARAQSGMYVKIGQYLSTLTHILPKEWTETLAPLQDRAPSLPWASVRGVFESDLGRAAADVFAEVDEQPVASASLAQVHRAVLRATGEEVAVKVQHPSLRWTAASDMASLHFFFWALEKAFPAYGYMWLFPEFRASVRNELNFLQEARNGQRVAAMFRDDAEVYVPRVHAELCSPRVLVMEFVRGHKPSDLAALRDMGVNPRRVASAVSRFFGEQVHVHGFVHCDPHPGNMLVRRRPSAGAPAGAPAGGGDFQLVILDHGMYRRLSPRFRVAYCRLWQALLTRDDALGLSACSELGVSAKAYDVLSLMLLQRSASSGAGLGARLTKTEVEELKSKYKDTKAADINRFMQRLPRDLLFVSRNTNMVRGLNLALGGTARERFRITGACAIKGLVLTDASEDDEALAAAGSANAAAVAVVSSSLVSDAAGIASLNPFTESELQRQREAAGAGVGVSRRGRLAYSIAMLEYRLWTIDFFWPFVMRWLGPAPDAAVIDDPAATIEVAKG